MSLVKVKNKYQIVIPENLRNRLKEGISTIITDLLLKLTVIFMSSAKPVLMT